MCVCREDPNIREMGEQFAANEDSLLAELQLATSTPTFPGLDQILLENEKLLSEKFVMWCCMLHVTYGCCCCCY